MANVVSMQISSVVFGIYYTRGCSAHLLVAKCYSNVASILAPTEVANKVAKVT